MKGSLKILSFFLFLTFLSIGACQRNHDSEVVRWNQAEEMPVAVQEQIDQLEDQNLKIEYQNLKVFRRPQQVSGVVVSDHFTQAVQQTDGQWQTVVTKLPPEVSPLQIVKAQYMAGKSERALVNFKRQKLGWKLLKSRVAFDKVNLSDWKAVYEVEAFSPDETDVVHFTLDSEGKILHQKSVAQHLVQGEAKVYGSSPDVSRLSFHVLPDLNGTGYLRSTRIHLVSDLSQQAYSPEHLFDFEPTEAVFDDVQAFYFADRAVRWFEDELNIKLNAPIEVKVHVGAPRKTNTAFYYDRKVRIGDGDGETYKNLPRDPTVVSHEIAHAFVQLISGLPFEGEGGSLNEAFADYYSAEINNQPHMADYAFVPGPYRRTLMNDMTTQDLSGGLYNDSLVVSGTLWDLRNVVGPKKSTELATLVLMRLGPHAQLKDFPQVVLNVYEPQLEEDDVTRLHQILFEKRQWPKE